MEAKSTTTLATLSKNSHQQVQLVFKKNVTADQVHQSLDRVFKELGCPGCGLGGLDFRLTPEEIFRPAQQLAGFQQLAGIKEISAIHA